MEIYLIVLVSILFYILSRLTTNVLLTILILVILVIVFYIYKENKVDKVSDSIKEDTKNQPLETTEYLIEKNSKDFKYLRKDDKLLEIAKNMRFTKRYDGARYSDLLNQLDTYMKYYIFMIKDRYDISHFLPILHDMYIKILENMYSFYLVLPSKMKHVFGFQPLDRLHKCINEFRKYGKEKLNIIKKYSNSVYIQDTDLEPYNSRNNLMLP